MIFAVLVQASLFSILRLFCWLRLIIVPFVIAFKSMKVCFISKMTQKKIKIELIEMKS